MVSSANMLAAVRMRGQSQPYYILAPPYVPTSAGIRVLHLLAHLINLSGESAWLYIPDGDATSLAPHLAGRLLTPAVQAAHHKAGCKPIVIYPETFEAPSGLGSLVIGYLLNFPGHLNGPVRLTRSDHNIAYTEELCATTDNCRYVLYIPASDPNFFTPPQDDLPRVGVAAYAGKYADVHGGRIGKIPNLREIIRRDEALPSTKLRDILRSRRALYVYENTAVATEALLCGCPVVRVSNPHFDQIIGEQRLGNEGYVDIREADQTNNLDSSITQALQRTTIFRDNYLRAFEDVGPQLAGLIAETQELAQRGPTSGFFPASGEISNLERFTAKLQSWAVSVRRIGWSKTLVLGMRRKYEQVTKEQF